MKRPSKPITIPQATAQQWEAAFRRTEHGFGKNRDRLWVLKCLADELKQMTAPRCPHGERLSDGCDREHREVTA